MAKALLLSIKPEWVAKILNKNKRYEIRKKIPTDYRGWVYIYCTSHKKYHESLYEVCEQDGGGYDVDYYIPSDTSFILNGKVVARFWCDNIETIRRYSESDGYGKNACYCFDYWDTRRLPDADLDIQNGSCLTARQLTEYANGKKELYAMHIQRLEIFDKPKDLIEFEYRKKYTKCANCPYNNKPSHVCMSCEEILPVKRPPQNFMYVESED